MLRLAFLDVKLILRHHLLSHALRIVQFLAPLTYQPSVIEQGAIAIYHLICHSADEHFTILLLLGPNAHVLVFLFKLLDLLSIESQVDEGILITHRLDDGVLDKVGIQLGVEEHILYGARNVLILGTLHNGIFTESQEFLTAVVAKDDVTIHLVTAHE